jgi:rubrerythrin
VDSQIETLTVALRAIRDHADAALKDVEQPATDRRSLGWKCSGCGYAKHFTRPALAEVAAPCPKCHGTTFEPC